MSDYRVMIGPLASSRLENLPGPARDALDNLLEDLSRNPWKAQARPGKPYMCTAVFGDAEEGLAYLTVSNDHEVIIVDELIWAGDL